MRTRLAIGLVTTLVLAVVVPTASTAYAAGEPFLADDFSLIIPS